MDIQNFIKYIKQTENKEFINYLKEIIENSDIGQILLDIHDNFKIDGINVYLILKSIESDDNEGLIEFFKVITKLFQIYNIIYKQIGKLIKTSIGELEKIMI